MWKGRIAAYFPSISLFNNIHLKFQHFEMTHCTQMINEGNLIVVSFYY